MQLLIIIMLVTIYSMEAKFKLIVYAISWEAMMTGELVQSLSCGLLLDHLAIYSAPDSNFGSIGWGCARIKDMLS